ncbi:hypothetical protein L218DRAFT_867130, partial [Marasmius fiardii PR-910]
GTWQFISAKLLSSNTSEHELADDLEYFFHVLAWQVLKYVPHKTDISSLITWIEYYEAGGYSKKLSLGARSMSRIGVENTALRELLSALEEVSRIRYEPEPSQVDSDVMAATERHMETAEPKMKYIHHNPRLESHDWFLLCFSAAAALKDEMPEKLRDNLANVVMYTESSRCRKGSDVFVGSEELGWRDMYWFKKGNMDWPEAEEERFTDSADSDMSVVED